MENGIIMNASWTTEIRKAWINPNAGQSHDPHNEEFLDVIWEISQTAFDIPREVQVVIDSKDELYMDFGTPGFVDFDNVPVGMVLPIKCWIHTHPFGAAYFSGTDWRTIRTWQSLMIEAIVIGDNEHMVWQKDEQHTVFYRKELVEDFYQLKLNEFGLELNDFQTKLTGWEEE